MYVYIIYIYICTDIDTHMRKTQDRQTHIAHRHGPCIWTPISVASVGRWCCSAPADWMLVKNSSFRFSIIKKKVRLCGRDAA